MKIAAAIAAAAAAPRVVVADGLHWQVRRITAEDLLRNGSAALPVLPLPADGGEAAPPADAAQQAMALARAWLCSAICGVSDDGVTWEPIRLVRTPGEADPEAGVVCVDDLPMRCLEALILQARDSEALADAIARFRVVA